MWEIIWEMVKELCGGGYAKIAGFLRVAWGKLLDCIPAVARKKAEVAIIDAKADVEVKKIQAQGKIEVDDMLRRRGFLAEWQQGNINSIVCKADGMRPPGGAQIFHDINKEWTADYIEKSKNCSNEEMQDIWAQILAGEATKPGSFSKKTVAIVSAMDKEDAELFAVFCQFVWTRIDKDGDILTPMIYDVRDELYKKEGINHSALVGLVAAGLISKGISLRTRTRPDEYTGPVKRKYFDTTVALTPTKREDGYYVSLGKYGLTKYGKQLYSVCLSLRRVQKNDAFFQRTLEEWRALGYNPVIQEKGAEE